MMQAMMLITDPGEAIAITTLGVSTIFVGYKLFLPIMQGLGRRLGGERGSGDPALHAEVDELRARVHELEGQQARMLELEERLDFTERLLTRQRDLGRLPAGSEE